MVRLSLTKEEQETLIGCLVLAMSQAADQAYPPLARLRTKVASAPDVLQPTSNKPRYPHADEVEASCTEVEDSITT